MESIIIRNTSDPNFPAVWEIYNYSFPENEKRELNHQITALLSENYRMYCYLDNEKIVEFIGCWEFDKYVYIEHFAIDKNSRGGGYGSRILSEFMKSTEKPIILEIDQVIDEISTKRLKFYKNSVL
ncbi:MAG: GNAT family N-acetyltransferase [Rikenellaceae bacterium]|nr:GNAT family N-acetyltransferase [Rikenellaceae bacterium]